MMNVDRIFNLKRRNHFKKVFILMDFFYVNFLVSFRLPKFGDSPKIGFFGVSKFENVIKNFKGNGFPIATIEIYV